MDSNLLLYGGAIAFVAIIFIFGMIKSKQSASKMNNKISAISNIKDTHPDVAKVYVFSKTDKTGFGSDISIGVLKINGDTVRILDEKSGSYSTDMNFEGNNWQVVMDETNKYNFMTFYIVPGKNTITAQYYNQREGIKYETITKYTDPITFDVNLEPHQSYLLNFDKDLVEFTIEPWHAN